MDRRRNLGIRRTLVLLALFYLVKSTTEQKIESRGGKSSNIVEKINGWRSQRGGSCLSYGHSCWGAHGKRSTAPRSLPPDLDFLRILGRMTYNTQMEENSPKRNSQMRTDLPAIYRTNDANDDEENSEIIGDVGNIKGTQAAAAYFKEERENGYPGGIPMLDDDFLTQTRIWKLMRAATASNEQ